ncbi:TlpA family protein disulfide reductase [Psychrobacillus glaciei]|uniref:TlpA family protein disulfide reductase n=1 Tax=Psychrobacillus glaciei TaxID=2283160 RepID=A0A5J6SKY6_9BACI|nr:redoxin domain-containing protein [Psychrobacillus glaciei]QFF98312.1 TlpA family protein disulfide reductase [Psychrobacillus glaciei]
MKLREEFPELPRHLQWVNGQVTKEQIIGDVPVLIQFWSISCNQCKSTMVHLHKWKSLYGDRFKIISIHMPRTIEDANDYLIYQTAMQMNMTYPICLDHELIVTKIFQNRIVPAYYLFDKKGLLRHYQSGESGMQMLERRLILLMNEQKM